MTLFMVFAVFGLLVFAQFQGRALDRLVAYLVTTLLGATLVAVALALCAVESRTKM